ncbi:integral membrane protein, partial [Pseudohyphozyma bogoriensis]
MVSARLAVAVALVVALAPPTFATLYQAHPTSCLDPSDSLTAPDDQQLVFSALYAQFDQGQAYPGEYGKGLNYSTIPALADEDGVELTGMGSVLRILLVGTTGAESEGFSNTTSFLSTVVVDSQVLTFPVQSNQSALCSSIRTPTSNTSADTGCPYGPGEVALGISIPLSSSYALTTINSQLVILDPSVPAMHLACLNLDLTPYYPSYFFYPLIRYLIVGTLAFYLVIYLIARLWASHTDIVSDNETLLASSLTIKLSSQDQALPKRKIWASIWYGAWSGRQVVGSGSLR